jgi:hypothetical protein
MLHGSIKKWGTRCEVYDHWTAQVFCPISLWQPCASLAARPERLAASRLPRYPVPGGFIWLAIDLLSRIDRIGLPGKVQLELPFWSFWFCLILLRVPRLWHCTQHCIKLGCFFFGSFQVACRVQQFCVLVCVPVIAIADWWCDMLIKHLSLCVCPSMAMDMIHWKYIFHHRM